MPYSSPKDLPPTVAALPEHAKTIWMAAFNGAFDPKVANEEKAFRIAWGAVKTAGYAKDDKGDWVKKNAAMIDVLKIDEEHRLVSGWFSVIEEGGQPVEDGEGDVIMLDDLRKAAHQFIGDARVAKLMHGGAQVGEVVDSIVLSPDIQKALGIDLGKVGWFGTMHITDDRVWARVKSGDLAAFSIGGTGERVALDPAA